MPSAIWFHSCPGAADAGGPGPARDAGQPAQITVSEGV